MATLRSRLAARLVLLVGLRRRLRALADLEGRPDELAKGLKRLRRTDRPDPPRRLKAVWHHEQFDVQGFPLHVMVAKASPAERIVLFLHGGGYLFGPFGLEWSAVAKMAASSGSDFAFFVYPKSPRHVAAETVDVTATAYRLLSDRYGAANVVLMGSSAGGGLALAVMMKVRAEGGGLPALAVLLSPGVDMTLAEDVSDYEEGDVMLSVEHVLSAGRLYAGAAEPADPSISPIFGDLRGLPPLHVFAGTSEILYPSLVAFVDRARAVGTNAHLIVGYDQQHVWPTAPTPEGLEALRQIASLIRKSGAI